jgi:putative N6-adenine-specific DNA methylase
MNLSKLLLTAANMTKDNNFEIFLATTPGLESVLCSEIRGKGFKQPKTVAGGVVIKGGWPEVWRANLWIRGASRVLARLDTFRVTHLAQLDNRARHVPWDSVLRPDTPFHVDVSCTKSRIYHSGAAAQRIATAIQETLGAIPSPDADIVIKARIDHDVCTISIDTSGDLLHKRGFKEAVNQAPMRENIVSLLLQQCGYTGSEAVVDPMCGSGTFIIEAAEIAARLNPGRSRSFAFEKFANFDNDAWQNMRKVKSQRTPQVRYYGSDRDAGAIKMSRANAERANVDNYTEFRQAAISDAHPPDCSPGLVIVNPPYGTRLGDKKKLLPLYSTFGQVLRARFKGWRVGLVASEPKLAFATKLPFLPTTTSFQHGGLRVTLFQTGCLT